MMELFGLLLVVNAIILWVLVLRSLTKPHTKTSRRVAIVSLITPFVLALPFVVLLALMIQYAG